MSKIHLPSNNIIKEYNEGSSLHQIAEKYNTYVNKILRLLKKLGIEIRNKSVAQSLALKTGRKIHPTEGKNRTNEEKEKISEKLTDFYDKMSDSEYNKIKQRSVKNWKRLSKETRQQMRERSGESNRRAAKEGSAVEKYVVELLKNEGYIVEHHKKNILSTALEVDIYLPNDAIVIEIDGPSHYKDIWGQDSLTRQQLADNKKNGILLNLELVLIRVKYNRSKFNLSVKNKIKNTLLSKLNEVSKIFPTKNKRLIELEIN